MSEQTVPEPSIAVPRGASASEGVFAPFLDKLARTAASREREEKPAGPLVRELLRLGFGRARVPAGLGGLGYSHEEFTRLLLALARADSNFSHIFRAHANFVELLLHAAGLGGGAVPESGGQAFENADAARRLLAEVASGAFLAPGASEPGRVRAHGTPTRTLVEGIGEDEVLTGRKGYSTGSAYADWFCVWVEDEKGSREIFVPSDAPGLTILDDWNGFGQRFSATNTVVYEQVPLDRAFAVEHRDSAFQAARGSYFQFFHSATQSGILQRLVDDIVATTVRRDRPLSNHAGGGAGGAENDPQIRQIVGEIAARAAAARTLLLASARRYDDFEAAEGERRARLAEEIVDDTAHLQVLLSDFLSRSTWQFFEAGGGSLLDRDLDYDRHWRNARAITSHNPTVYRARDIGGRLFERHRAADGTTAAAEHEGTSTRKATTHGH